MHHSLRMFRLFDSIRTRHFRDSYPVAVNRLMGTRMGKWSPVTGAVVVAAVTGHQSPVTIDHRSSADLTIYVKTRPRTDHLDLVLVALQSHTLPIISSWRTNSPYLIPHSSLLLTWVTRRDRLVYGYSLRLPYWITKSRRA